LIYIDRIIQRQGFVINSLNVHRVVITSIMLAAKFFDDHYFKNGFYAKVGGVPCNEMNSLEVEFLFLLNFSLHVPPETYKKYYVELCNHAQTLPSVEKRKCWHGCIGYSVCFCPRKERILLTPVPVANDRCHCICCFLLLLLWTVPPPLEFTGKYGELKFVDEKSIEQSPDSVQQTPGGMGGSNAAGGKCGGSDSGGKSSGGKTSSTGSGWTIGSGSPQAPETSPPVKMPSPPQVVFSSWKKEEDCSCVCCFKDAVAVQRCQRVSMRFWALGNGLYLKVNNNRGLCWTRLHIRMVVALVPVQ
jgi:uncharacterized membrane protein YgcG